MQILPSSLFYPMHSPFNKGLCPVIQCFAGSTEPLPKKASILAATLIFPKTRLCRGFSERCTIAQSRCEILCFAQKPNTHNALHRLLGASCFQLSAYKNFNTFLSGNAKINVTTQLYSVSGATVRKSIFPNANFFTINPKATM